MCAVVTKRFTASKALAPVYIGMIGMGDEYAHQHSFTRQGVHFLVRMRSTLHTHNYAHGMRMACAYALVSRATPLSLSIGGVAYETSTCLISSFATNKRCCADDLL